MQTFSGPGEDRLLERVRGGQRIAAGVLPRIGVDDVARVGESGSNGASRPGCP